ncbi:MAG TPA: hypothetical protein VMI92_01300 [Steroidobacteraceae bacterium]|nr:hypothetical protein [Steroidobacteraceae bacterium]
MKLVFQIAGGIVLAWLCIGVLEALAARYEFKVFMQSMPRVPALSSRSLVSQPKALPPTTIRGTEPVPADDGRRWSIQGIDGKTYSGIGAPPSGGLSQSKPDREAQPAR